SDHFDGLLRRVSAWQDESETEKHRRLIQIMDFVKTLNFGTEFDRNMAKAQLRELEGQGQSAYYDSNYFTLTAGIVVVAEALRLHSFQSRLSPYSSQSLSPSDRILATEIFKDSLESIVRTLDIYGYDNDKREEM